MRLVAYFKCTCDTCVHVILHVIHVVSHVSLCYIIGCPPPACQQISENLAPPLQNPGSAYDGSCNAAPPLPDFLVVGRIVSCDKIISGEKVIF